MSVYHNVQENNAETMDVVDLADFVQAIKFVPQIYVSVFKTVQERNVGTTDAEERAEHAEEIKHA